MGTFTTSQQFQLGLNIANPWWLSGASIDLDFRNGRYYDSSLTTLKQPLAPLNSYLSITRASTGYAKTSTGTLTSFGNNVLRVTNLGLLIEDARTNTYSVSQDLVAWGSNSAAVTTTNNQTTAPDLTATAGSQLSNGGTNTYYTFQTGISVTAGLWTVSYFAKSAGAPYAYLSSVDNAGNRYAIVIDLSSGAITANNSVGSPTSVASYSEPFGNGWYRLSVTQNFSASPGSGGMQIGFGNEAVPSSWSGNVPSGQVIANGLGIYAWGFQMEAGGFVSSYIPALGAQATRAAESISISGSAQSLINSTTASIIAQLNNGGSINYAATAVDSNGTNLLGFDATNHGLASITASLATTNTANRTSRDKLGIAWSGAGRSLVLNGGTVATDATAQTPSATQKLGSAGGTSNFVYAYIERLSIWNSKLADATLQALTV
jgi:hypothetical protein